jgi:hypothetical protein
MVGGWSSEAVEPVMGVLSGVGVGVGVGDGDGNSAFETEKRKGRRVRTNPAASEEVMVT